MLFNSYLFLFGFLPFTLLAVALARPFGGRTVQGTLAVASLIFYGWFVPGYVLLLLGSILVNYTIGIAVERRRDDRRALTLGVALNLGLLCLCKYLDFLIGTANALLATDWAFANLVLPLAISFFTFQQIAYLVDLHRGTASTPTLLEYLLFVCLFPHLIAGPIVHHSELIPQFRRPEFGRLTAAGLLTGLTWFAIGLAKKVLIADSLTPVTGTAFGIAASGGQPSLLEAWSGALAFAFQIYFDFSGYSDMAIGLGLMFGFVLPLNFNAPYRAESIIEFWRRWHMTLSRFLRDYLYIPLGGNRHGSARRYANLMITMLLGGLWHGANWTFAVWGGLHGIYLAINHLWCAAGLRLPRAAGWLLTFVAVCFAWTFFRAENFAAAWRMVEGMAGGNGIVLAAEHRAILGAAGDLLARLGVRFEGLPAFRLSYMPLFLGLIGAALLLPTTQALMGWAREWRFVWRPGLAWGAVAGSLLAVAILGIGRTSEFIYFQF
jgi:D-alanyl-lipoteichoic acid acyltransferase DltB (MBOAT superfamily)